MLSARSNKAARTNERLEEAMDDGNMMARAQYLYFIRRRMLDDNGLATYYTRDSSTWVSSRVLTAAVGSVTVTVSVDLKRSALKWTSLEEKEALLTTARNGGWQCWPVRWGVGGGVWGEELLWLDGEGEMLFLHVVRTAPVSSDKDAVNDKTGGYSADSCACEWAWLLEQVVECRQEVRDWTVLFCKSILDH